MATRKRKAAKKSRGVRKGASASVRSNAAKDADKKLIAKLERDLAAAKKALAKERSKKSKKRAEKKSAKKSTKKGAKPISKKSSSKTTSKAPKAEKAKAPKAEKKKAPKPEKTKVAEPKPETSSKPTEVITALTSRERVEKDLQETYYNLRARGEITAENSSSTPHRGRLGTINMHLRVDQILTRESVGDFVAKCVDAAERVDGSLRAASLQNPVPSFWTTVTVFTTLAKRVGDGRSNVVEFQNHKSSSHFMTANAGHSGVRLGRYENEVRKMFLRLLQWPTIVVVIDIYGKDTAQRLHRRGRY